MRRSRKVLRSQMCSASQRQRGGWLDARNPLGLGPCTALLCGVLVPHCTIRMSHSYTFHVPSPSYAFRLSLLAFVDMPFSVLVALQ